MARWVVEHRDHSYILLGSEIPPNDLTFTLRKGKEGPDDISYVLPLLRDNDYLDIPDIYDFVYPYKTDYYLKRYNRDDQVTFQTSGIHVDTHLQSEQDFTQIAGKSWLHYFERRLYPFDPLNPNANRYTEGGYGMVTNPERGLAARRTYLKGSDIVKFLLDKIMLQQPYGLEFFDYDIADTPETSEPWELPLNDTQDLLQHIQELAEERDAGFDFGIDASDPPNKTFWMVYPGTATGDSVITFTSSTETNPGLVRVEFANRGPGVNRFTGYGSGNDVKLGLLVEDNGAALIYRRQEGTEDFGDVETRLRVNRLTADAFARQKDPYHDISIDVNPEAYGDHWPGDLFWSVVKPGALCHLQANLHHSEIDAVYEIMSMDCAVSNEGNESATLNLEKPYNATSEITGTILTGGGEEYDAEHGSGLRFFT